MTITVVTAYYEIRSKFSTTQYWEWINSFCTIPFNVVIYTSPDLVEKFQSLRESMIEKTKIIGMELKDLYHYKFLKEYEKHYEMDWNKDHSPELFIIWAEKIKFVTKSIELNVFDTDKFIWCDIGAFRDQNYMKYYMNFPQEKNIIEDKMNLLLINPFEPKDSVPIKNIIGQDYFNKESRLGGGIQVGNIKAWKDYEVLWDDTLKEYFKNDKFAGQDQCITGTIYLRHSELFHIITCPKKGYGDGWFYLLLYFSVL